MVARQWWGLELMSGIPGTVGGAAAININAYGQSLTDTLLWVKVYDKKSQCLKKIDFKPQDWGYKKSPLASSRYIILRVALKLSSTQTTKLKYASALAYAQKQQLPIDDLKARRKLFKIFKHKKPGRFPTR